MPMDLERNICDTVKEWEIKIGYREGALSLFYPKESLLELLPSEEEEFESRLKDFCLRVRERLGRLSVWETEEKGRYCVKIPAQGTAYIHERIAEPVFLKEFLREIQKPGNGLLEIQNLFLRFSEHIIVRKAESKEWGFGFEDPSVDPYIYHVKEDAFGLEYHRFTRDTYGRLFQTEI